MADKMLRAVWMNPTCETVREACADKLHEELDWPIEDCRSHAAYHARKSQTYRRTYNLPETGEYD